MQEKRGMSFYITYDVFIKWQNSSMLYSRSRRHRYMIHSTDLVCAA